MQRMTVVYQQYRKVYQKRARFLWSYQKVQVLSTISTDYQNKNIQHIIQQQKVLTNDYTTYILAYMFLEFLFMTFVVYMEKEMGSALP